MLIPFNDDRDSMKLGRRGTKLVEGSQSFTLSITLNKLSRILLTKKKNAMYNFFFNIIC